MALASTQELVLTGSTCTRVLVRLGGQDSCVRQVSDCSVQKRSVVMQQCNSSEQHAMPLLEMVSLILRDHGVLTYRNTRITQTVYEVLLVFL